MAEDKKKKPGLHKNISSIFEGVPLPQPGSVQGPSGAPPVPPAEGGVPQKPMPPSLQALRMVPASPRAYESGQPSAETAPAGQPRAEPAKAGGLIGLWEKIRNKLLATKSGVSGTRQKVMLVLVPALLVVFVFMVISIVGPTLKTPMPIKAGAPGAVTVSLESKIDWELPPPYPATLRDPMQAAPSVIAPVEPETKETQQEEEKSGRLVVKGILYSEDNPSAIIDTQIVHIGDKIYGATVVKINRDSVEFEIDGKKETKGVEP